MKITEEFYQRWRMATIAKKPHQIPPSKEQMEYLLDILEPNEQELILHQFDEDVEGNFK